MQKHISILLQCDLMSICMHFYVVLPHENLVTFPCTMKCMYIGDVLTALKHKLFIYNFFFCFMTSYYER